jgi:putative superfamily III holin-X
LASTRLTPSQTSLVELVSQLAADARLLVREILELARAELGVRLSELRGLLVLLAAAGGALLVGLFAGTAAAVAALALVMPLWAAALVVAVAVLALAAALARAAVARLRRIAQPPELTLGALKEGAQWLRAP